MELNFETIQSLVEGKYGRKVIAGSATIIHCTDPSQMTSGWDAEQLDYAHYAISMSFTTLNEEQLLDSDIVVVSDFTVGVDVKDQVTRSNIIFKFLNAGSFSNYHFIGYRFKLA